MGTCRVVITASFKSCGAHTIHVVPETAISAAPVPCGTLLAVFVLESWKIGVACGACACAEAAKPAIDWRLTHSCHVSNLNRYVGSSV